MGFLDIVPEISGILRELFPDADENQYITWSERIYEDWIPAKALEELSKGDRPSNLDVDGLLLAVKKLRLAQKVLKRLGGHGNDALLSVIEFHPNLPHSTDKIFGNAPEFVSGEIENIVQQIDAAASQLYDGRPALSAVFGDDDKDLHAVNTKPRKTSARAVASSCGAAFLNFTGRKPTVATRPSSGEAYGPFLLFVEMIFEVLQIDASAETFARQAVKDF